MVPLGAVPQGSSINRGNDEIGATLNAGQIHPIRNSRKFLCHRGFRPSRRAGIRATFAAARGSFQCEQRCHRSRVARNGGRSA